MNSQDQNKARVRKYAPDAVVNAERFGISSAPDCGGMKIMVIAARGRNAGGLYEWTAQPVYAVRRNLWATMALRFKNWSAKVINDHLFTRGEW
jgi:hypothetical protein